MKNKADVDNCCLYIEKRRGIDLIGGVLIINVFFCGLNIYDAWVSERVTHTYKYVYPLM